MIKTIWARRPTRNRSPAVHTPEDQGWGPLLFHLGSILCWKCFPCVSLYFRLFLFCCSCFLLKKRNCLVTALRSWFCLEHSRCCSVRKSWKSVSTASGLGSGQRPSRVLFVVSPGNALVGSSTVVGALSLIREATIFCFLPKNKLSQFPKFNRDHWKLFFSIKPILLVQNYH